MTRGDLKPFFLNENAEKAFGFAQAIVRGDTLYVSGVLAVDEAYEPVEEGDMHGQLRCIYERIGEILQAHGRTIADVLKETVFVTDMGAFLAANTVRLDAYAGHVPCCSAVQVQALAFPPCMAEVELIVAM